MIHPRQADASELTWDARPLIGGERLVSTATATFDLVSPRDGSVFCAIANGTQNDVDAAVESARSTFDSGVWSRLSARERGRIMIRFADLVGSKAPELALRICLEMGKPVQDALAVELKATAECLRWYGEAADKYYGDLPDASPNALALITRAPAGVVAAVIPWNFPLTMLAWKIGPALAAGNSVVVKPAEQTTVSALELCALALDAGIPKGALNVVPGRGDVVGEALGRHSGVDVVTFTGSLAVGRRFLSYAAESNGKRVWPELGGKSASLILSDADSETAGRVSAWAAFYNQGQMCSASSRMVVLRDVHDRAVAAAVAQANSMIPADPLSGSAQNGAIVSERALERTLGFVQRAVADGAVLVAGSTERYDIGTGKGSYVSPVVLTNVRPDMEIAQEEVFGPVLSVIAVDSLDEGVAVANGTPFGLGAGLWTRDLSLAHGVSRRLRAGTVWVNCYEEGTISMPFGGVGSSGFGRDKGLSAIDKYSDLKSTWIELES